MIRQDYARVPKARSQDHRKKQFAEPTFKKLDYKHRLNFYDVPPVADITLEQFEQWAIDRLRVLAELEACSFRNKTPPETAAHMKPLLDKYLPLSPNTSASNSLQNERQKDHYSHFILRLAFSSTEDLRRRFSRVETMLFKLRFQKDDQRERQAFVQGLNLDWETVGEEERREFAEELRAAAGGLRRLDDESWFKVDWERVPELVERRAVFLRGGKAFVPGKEQSSMVVAEFAGRLDRALEMTSRALPRLDEDDRLTPILTHLSQNFTTPDASYSSSVGESLPGAAITARSIDTLSPSFPLCMQNLHQSLRRDSHLKHYSRLQYTLFLKGIGLSLPECLLFWRSSFNKITDEVFNKEYRYNVRHVYGDVGGDGNRRGNGYAPFSCQKILTEHQPGTGESHGCPYRHFDAENLVGLLEKVGVRDRDVVNGVLEDKERKRFHLACNRVFEHQHKSEIKKVREDGTWGAAQLETIVHPNEYFKRSYLLRNLGRGCVGCGAEGKEEKEEEEDMGGKEGEGEGDFKMEGA